MKKVCLLRQKKEILERVLGDAGENGQRRKQRPSAVKEVATDWVTGGCLRRCLMYSRISVRELLERCELVRTLSTNGREERGSIHRTRGSGLVSRWSPSG